MKDEDFCRNSDECNICTPNHHEIRLNMELETLWPNKPTNPTSTYRTPKHGTQRKRTLNVACANTLQRRGHRRIGNSVTNGSSEYIAPDRSFCGPHDAERDNGWTTHLLSGKSQAQDTQRSTHKKRSTGKTERTNLSPEQSTNSCSIPRTENASPKNAPTAN